MRLLIEMFAEMVSDYVMDFLWISYPLPFAIVYKLVLQFFPVQIFCRFEHARIAICRSFNIIYNSAYSLLMLTLADHSYFMGDFVPLAFDLFHLFWVLGILAFDL